MKKNMHPYLAGGNDGKANVELPEGFEQVLVWENTDLGDFSENRSLTPVEFESWIKVDKNCRVKFLEEIETYGDMDENGNLIPDTGGRIDILFAVSDNDAESIGSQKLEFGGDGHLNWIEITYGNNAHYQYPKRIQEYCSWDNYSSADMPFKRNEELKKN